MNTAIIDVTPAMAHDWMKQNTHNRTLRSSVVERYARDMASGEWRLTHQGIALDGNGIVLDGQHRLQAIIDSNTTVRMPVTFGVPAGAQLVVDTQLVRSIHDAATLSGTPVSAAHIVTTRALHRGFRTILTTMTRVEFMAIYARHQKAIDFAVEHTGGQTKHPSTRGGIRGAIARAHYHENHDRLVAFCKILLSGVPQDVEADMMALTLRNMALENKWTSRSGTGLAAESYRKAARAIQLFCAKDRQDRLYAIPREIYPLPEEQA